MQALTIVGLSNLISTLLVIVLQHGYANFGFLIIQSVFSTVVMILNLNMFTLFKAYLFGWEKDNPDSWIKNRLNSYLTLIDSSLSSKFIPILNIGLIFQSTLLLMQSNQKIWISTFFALSLHYCIQDYITFMAS